MDDYLTLQDLLWLAMMLPVEKQISTVQELLLCAYEQGFELSEIAEKHARILLGE